MKKIICIFLAALFLVSVAVSCADSKADGQTTANTSEATASSAESSSPEESTSAPEESTSEAESTDAVTENSESTSTEPVAEPATETIVTQPPATEPAEVTQAVAEPVVTTPPATEAPVTTVPVTEAPALVIPENGEIMEGSPYPDPFSLTSFSNVTELYEYLKNMSEKEFDKILAQEQWYLWDTVQSIHVSKDELQNGIFGYFKNSLLSNKGVTVPCLNGIPSGIADGRSIKLETADSFRKTRIVYPADSGITFYIMKFDSELVTEANAKGASWLIGKLNPEHMNLHNYKECISKDVANGIRGVKDMTVYEKEYALGDRKVKTLVYDNSDLSDELLSYGMKPHLEIFFVYNDMLIKAIGHPDDVTSTFPKLTFKEVKAES